jgi:hypothetical protein
MGQEQKKKKKPLLKCHCKTPSFNIGLAQWFSTWGDFSPH